MSGRGSNLEQDLQSSRVSGEQWEKLGATLEAARRSAGLRQEDVANLLGINRPTLSSIESGKTRVSSLTLNRLARLYRRDLGSLFAAAEELRPVDQMLFARLGDLSPQDRATLVRFLEFCDNLSFLRELLGRQRREIALPRPLPTSVGRYAAEALARVERARFGLADGPVGERLFDLLEMVGIQVYRAPLEDTRLSGLFVDHPSAGPVILINSSQYRWRQVFTLAHQYGHFLFRRTTQPIACRGFGVGNDASRVTDVTDEDFMNAFASEFLMPKAGIQSLLMAMGGGSEQVDPAEVVRLQRHFGVSFQAMLYRLLRLRLLREVDVQRMKAEIHPMELAWKMGHKVEEEVLGQAADGADELNLASKFPTDYVEMVLDALEQGHISSGKAATLLELDRWAFDRFCRLRQRAAELGQQDEELEQVVG